MRRLALFMSLLLIVVTFSSCQIYALKMSRPIKLSKCEMMSLSYFPEADFCGYINMPDYFSAVKPYSKYSALPVSVLFDNQGNLVDLSYNPNGDSYCPGERDEIIREFSPETPKKLLSKEESQFMLEIFSKINYWTEPFSFDNMSDYDYVLVQGGLYNLKKVRERLQTNIKQASDNTNYRIATIYVNLNNIKE